MRDDLNELKRRHAEFVVSLPEGPRRLRVVWLVGTPTEQALGLRRALEWVAEAMFAGDLDRARPVVFDVFEHAWRQAYDGKLRETYLQRSLFGEGFRARAREWSDAQRRAEGRCADTWRTEGEGPPPTEPVLSPEQLDQLACEALEKLRRGGTG